MLKIIDSIANRMAAGLGVDLGTANTLIHIQGQGIGLREPSVVAVSAENPARVLEVGEEAKVMIGRTPKSVIAARPLKDGVIADFDQTERMLRYFIDKVQRKRTFFNPQIVIGVPNGITEVERLAVIEAGKKAGAREIFLLSEPMAAAIGAGIKVTQPSGSMIVDIGGGTSEVAVIAFKGIVLCGSIRIAGDELDEAIIDYVRHKYKLLIGYRTAEECKIAIGSAMPLGKELSKELRGRDLVTGLPRSLMVTSQEIREAIQDHVVTIVDLIMSTLEATPPELAADILQSGIVLAGGGALLKGLDKLVGRVTGMPIHIAPDPLSCVANGAGMFLQEINRNYAMREVAMEHVRFAWI